MQAPLPWTCPLPFKPSCPQLARHHRQQPEVSVIHRRRLVVRLDHRHDAAFHVPSLPRVCRRRHGSHISSARQVHTHSVVAQKLLHACSCASHVYIPPDTATLYMKLRVACVEDGGNRALNAGNYRNTHTTAITVLKCGHSGKMKFLLGVNETFNTP